MNNLKQDSGAVTIKTAYGDKEMNSNIGFVEKSELIALVNEALSVRGKDAKEFSNKLKDLLVDYLPIELPRAKDITEAPILIAKNIYKQK